MAKYSHLAQDIIDHIGGDGNIKTVGHCLTRLRFVLKDLAKADTPYLSEHSDIFKVVQAGGQYQLVIGNHVSDVYDAVQDCLAKKDSSAQPLSLLPTSLFSRVLLFLLAVFQPCLPILTASGMIKVLVSFLSFFFPSQGHPALYLMLEVAGDGLLQFLPIVVAYSASKHLKLNVSTGLAIAMAVLYPSLGEATVLASWTGGALDYHRTALPILLAILFAARLERFFKTALPQAVRTFLVPFFILLLTVPTTLLVFGPLIRQVTQLLLVIFTYLSSLNPLLYALLLSVSWPILLIFSLHNQLLIPLSIVERPLPISLVPYLTIGLSLSQLGLLLALMRIQKLAKEPAVTATAVTASLCGVPEVSLYRFALPLKSLFLITSLSMGCQGLYLAYRQMSIPTLAVSPVELAIMGLLTSCLLTRYSLKPDTNRVQEPLKTTGDKGLVQKVLTSPLLAHLLPLSAMPDPVFSSGAMGPGLALEPIDGRVFAPASGVVTSLFPTGHALTLVTDDGVELLIHIGLNTVNLKGKGFETRVVQGQRVEQGQDLLRVDLDLLQAQGFQATTALIITSMGPYHSLKINPVDKVAPEDDLLWLEQKVN